MPKYKIIEYHKEYMAHLCEVIDGQWTPYKRHYIDLFVDGGFAETNPESVIGKIATIEELQPHISLGIRVSIGDK